MMEEQDPGMKLCPFRSVLTERPEFREHESGVKLPTGRTMLDSKFQPCYGPVCKLCTITSPAAPGEMWKCAIVVAAEALRALSLGAVEAAVVLNEELSGIRDAMDRGGDPHEGN